MPGYYRFCSYYGFCSWIRSCFFCPREFLSGVLASWRFNLFVALRVPWCLCVELRSYPYPVRLRGRCRDRGRCRPTTDFVVTTDFVSWRFNLFVALRDPWCLCVEL